MHKRRSMLRIVLTTAVVAALLILAKSERVLERTGIVGTCTPVAVVGADGGQWWACRSGHLFDAPDLWRESCTEGERRDDVRYWYCPTSLMIERATRTRK
jgi:hypothetical protein